MGRRYAVGRMTDYVIFDCHRLHLDTEPISSRVLAGLLASAGMPAIVEESMRDDHGRSMAAVLGLVEKRLGAPLRTDIADLTASGSGSTSSARRCSQPRSPSGSLRPISLRAAETMGSDPARTAVVEDSPAGLAVGMWAPAFAGYDPQAGLRAIGGGPLEEMTILSLLVTAGSRVP